MGRLIDTDGLEECILEKGEILIDENVEKCESMHDVLVYLLEKVQDEVSRQIDLRLTAFNTEAVVEELKANCFWTASTYDEDGYCNDDSEEAVYLDKAIEIVRKGGVK